MSLGARHEGRVRYRIEIEPPVREVMLDGHAFQQCLANLIRNAVEAIPRDREGTVKVGHRIDGDTAVFTVSDDGVGMTTEIIEKIRGGMYSTKGSKGTGLGLLVIRKIVKEHGGVLKIESEPAKGSTFRIEVPAGGREAVA
jgi:two-component system sporulation sensor kinase B